MTDDCRRDCKVLSRWEQYVLEGERFGVSCIRLETDELAAVSEILAAWPYLDQMTMEDEHDRGMALFDAEGRHRAKASQG